MSRSSLARAVARCALGAAASAAVSLVMIGSAGASLPRPEVAVGTGWMVPLDSRVREVYGSAPFLSLGLAMPVRGRWSMEGRAAALHRTSSLSAPSFVDRAKGELTQLPFSLGLARATDGPGVWARAAALGVWSREKVEYDLLDLDESLHHSRFDPGAAVAAGWTFAPRGFRVRVGMEAAWVAADRRVLRAKGDTPKSEDASAGSYLGLTWEARF